MADLFVHLKIPIPTEPLVGAPALTFARWLPIGDSNAINVDRDNISLKLWFDITSTSWASRHKEEDLATMMNVLAHWVFADAVVRDVSDDLLRYMAQRDFTRSATSEEQSLQERYDEVAERLLVLVLKTLNRLMSYIRSRKPDILLFFDTEGAFHETMHHAGRNFYYPDVQFANIVHDIMEYRNLARVPFPLDGVDEKTRKELLANPGDTRSGAYWGDLLRQKCFPNR